MIYVCLTTSINRASEAIAGMPSGMVYLAYNHRDAKDFIAAMQFHSPGERVVVVQFARRVAKRKKN